MFPRPLPALFALVLLVLGGILLSAYSNSGWGALLPQSAEALLFGDSSGDPSTGTVIATADGGIDVEATAAAAAAMDAGGLAAGLEASLGRARAAASADSVELPVASGYRSAHEQTSLLVQELAEREGLEEAMRWVFAPDRSMHVRGMAIDINSGPGADWLEINGAEFGLCKTLSWEWWHFEWRERWERDRACPPPAARLEDVPGP